MTKIWRKLEWEEKLKRDPDKPLKISPDLIINKNKPIKKKKNDRRS